MLKDRILAGTIAGMIAAMIKDIPNLILWKLGIVKYCYFILAASSLLSPKDCTTILGWVVGIVVDIITGGTLGLLLIYLFRFTGRDYWWYKGLIIGNVIWLFGLGIAVNFGAARIVPLQPVFRLASLAEHQVFGLVGAYLIIKWYPEISHQIEEKKQMVNKPLTRILFPEPARKRELNKKKMRPVKPKKL